MEVLRLQVIAKVNYITVFNAQQQISKNRCFKSYSSSDRGFQFNNKCLSLLICLGLHLCKIQNGYVITSLSFLKNMFMKLKRKIENIYIFVFISSFGVFIYVQYFSDVVRNQTKKYLLDVIKWRSKDYEKNMSREQALHFDQW